MRRVLFLFLDGVGLAKSDPSVNPLVAGQYGTLMRLTDGVPLSAEAGRLTTPLADLIPLDAQMGVAGRPQSATGQAALLTGKNAPAAVGEHYGPRPDERVRELLRNGNLFSTTQQLGLDSYFCNAYPDSYFAAVDRGKRLLSAIPFAAQTAGLRLLRPADLEAGVALSADYTNLGWRQHLGYDGIPVYEPEEAGEVFWKLAQPFGFVFHDHWMTDVLGHKQRLAEAVEDLDTFDRFLGGLIAVADMESTLIVVASDHGNVEDCSHGKHTLNPALCMLIGDRRGILVESLRNLSDISPAILQYLAAANA